MNRTMPERFTFNVIYTPGTAEPLRRFVPSWLRHTGSYFRLVANGCSDREARLLERLAETSERLLFYRLPTDQMEPHGVVLDRLHALEESDWFCFMDSDIFAVGDFVTELLPDLEGNCGFFTGSPIWSIPSDQVAPRGVSFCGPHNRNEDGLVVGSSYFAIYRNCELTDLMRETGAEFRMYESLEEVPADLHATLLEAGCSADIYEAGKLINILLQCRGHRTVFRDLDGLCHIGGLSLLAEKRLLGKPYLEIDGDQVKIAKGCSEKIRPWILRKRLTCHYVSECLAALLAGRESDAPLLVEEPEVRQVVLETTRQLEEGIRRDADLFHTMDKRGWIASLWERLRL